MVYTTSNDMLMPNFQQENPWKGVVVYFQVLYQNLSKKTEKKIYVNSQLP